MTTKPEILDAARVVLRRGDALTLDAVAREAGLTKPGLVHHFSSKEALSIAVAENVLESWETELRRRAGEDSDPRTRLKTYVEYTLTTDLDASDLALMADVRLRETLMETWLDRLEPWFGGDIAQHPQARAARLIADGAWFNQSLGIITLAPAEQDAILAIAVNLIDGATE